jgi:hypothetical protein
MIYAYTNSIFLYLVLQQICAITLTFSDRHQCTAYSENLSLSSPIHFAERLKFTC